MTKKISVFLFLFFIVAAIQASDDKYVPLALTLAGPEPIYFVVENGPDIFGIGFRNETSAPYQVFNNFDEGWDGVVFLPDDGEIFYPVVGLKPWQSGQLQSWVFKENSETEQGWTIFQSGHMMPNRSQPPTALFSMALATVANGKKPVGTASVQPPGKLTTTWGRMKQ